MSKDRSYFLPCRFKGWHVCMTAYVITIIASYLLYKNTKCPSPVLRYLTTPPLRNQPMYVCECVGLGSGAFQFLGFPRATLNIQLQCLSRNSRLSSLIHSTTGWQPLYLSNFSFRILLLLSYTLTDVPPFCLLIKLILLIKINR